MGVKASKMDLRLITEQINKGLFGCCFEGFCFLFLAENYVHFGVFELYGDRALDISLKMLLCNFCSAINWALILHILRGCLIGRFVCGMRSTLLD